MLNTASKKEKTNAESQRCRGGGQDPWDSYYLGAKPGFYGAVARPSTGADRPDGTYPAQERYLEGASP